MYRSLSALALAASLMAPSPASAGPLRQSVKVARKAPKKRVIHPIARWGGIRGSIKPKTRITKPIKGNSIAIKPIVSDPAVKVRVGKNNTVIIHSPGHAPTGRKGPVVWAKSFDVSLDPDAPAVSVRQTRGRRFSVQAKAGFTARRLAESLVSAVNTRKGSEFRARLVSSSTGVATVRFEKRHAPEATANKGQPIRVLVKPD
jgi:hypothetical protein